MHSKELKDMSYNELIDDATWMVAQNIIHGKTLRSSVGAVCQLVLLWQEERQKELNK